MKPPTAEEREEAAGRRRVRDKIESFAADQAAHIAARRKAVRTATRRYYGDGEHWPHGMAVFIGWDGAVERATVNDFVSQRTAAGVSTEQVGVTVHGNHCIARKGWLVQALEPMLR